MITITITLKNTQLSQHSTQVSQHSWSEAEFLQSAFVDEIKHITLLDGFKSLEIDISGLTYRFVKSK